MSKIIHKEIGKMIRKCRERDGMTQLQLSEKLGYDSPQFVSLFERGLSKIPAQTIGKISKVFDNFPLEAISEMLVEDFAETVQKEIQRGAR